VSAEIGGLWIGRGGVHIVSYCVHGIKKLSEFGGGGVRRHGQNLPETSDQRKNFVLLFPIFFKDFS
jgi:hypothetical protein